MTDTNQLRGHNFDGIEEFDNSLPNWWLWTFYLAIIFAVFYWFHYHAIGTGALPAEEFQQEMEAAEARLAASLEGKEVTDASLLALAAEPTVVQKGAQIFATNCVACHLANAGGSIGPNLTDDYWIHGGKPTDLYKTVTEGVPAKGMITWLPVLGPLRCQQVVAYLLTIKNTNVAGGKAPQGEPEK